MLAIEGLTCGYGAATVVHGLDLAVAPGEVVALIGPNGAGKTSTLQCIAGHVRQQSGRIHLFGKDIALLPPQRRVREGIAIAPEGRRLFGELTVRENLIVGGFSRPKDEAAADLDRVLDLFPRLEERLLSLARTLSGGEQQMVAIGRALMARPRLLLIDELSLGLMPKNVDICYQALDRLRGGGLGVLLVEQNLARALAFADRAVFLDSGRLVWAGSCTAARARGDLVESILGQALDKPRAEPTEPAASALA